MGFQIELASPRDTHRSLIGRYGAVVTALLNRADAEVFLAMVPPAPLVQRGSLVTVVHDLRWLRTRSVLARSYRLTDLRTAAARSAFLIAVSDRTATELSTVVPKHAAKIRTVHLGPGQIETPYFDPRPQGRLLLLGSGQHKRNELAASVLLTSRPAWLTEVVAIGVSSETRRILDDPPDWLTVTTYERVSQEVLVGILRTCTWYMHLGVEEGFGLPFLEALASGCQVIAVDQPVTREVLGGAAVLLTDGDDRFLAQQVGQLVPVPLEARLQRSKESSWDHCADLFAQILKAAAS